MKRQHSTIIPHGVRILHTNSTSAYRVSPGGCLPHDRMTPAAEAQRGYPWTPQGGRHAEQRDRIRSPHTLYHRITGSVTHWMASYSVMLLRLSLGSVFLWFGLLKFFPDLSPAEVLARRTLDTLTLGYLSPQLTLPLLALWESAIGVGLLLGMYPFITLVLLFLHMGGTFTPLFLFPNDVFAHIPYAPTFETQYILKNLVFISAGCVLGTSRRGRRREARLLSGANRR